MSTQVIELDGLEIELAAELYCDRGGDHRELVDRARTDRRRLGHNVDESAVFGGRGIKDLSPKAWERVVSGQERQASMLSGRVQRAPRTQHDEYCQLEGS